eukprot:6491984-Amphidinium_carterae.2
MTLVLGHVPRGAATFEEHNDDAMVDATIKELTTICGAFVGFLDPMSTAVPASDVLSFLKAEKQTPTTKMVRKAAESPRRRVGEEL